MVHPYTLLAAAMVTAVQTQMKRINPTDQVDIFPLQVPPVER